MSNSVRVLDKFCEYITGATRELSSIYFLLVGVDCGRVYYAFTREGNHFPVGYIRDCIDISEAEIEVMAADMFDDLNVPTSARLEDYQAVRQGVAWIGDTTELADVVPLDAVLAMPNSLRGSV